MSVLFDTITPSGNINENNKMLVFNYTEIASNYYSQDFDYARGHAFPDGEEPGPPATYDWLGDLCVGTGS